jgi:hypothetical protein
MEDKEEGKFSSLGLCAVVVNIFLCLGGEGSLPEALSTFLP